MIASGCPQAVDNSGALSTGGGLPLPGRRPLGHGGSAHRAADAAGRRRAGMRRKEDGAMSQENTITLRGFVTAEPKFWQTTPTQTPRRRDPGGLHSPAAEPGHRGVGGRGHVVLHREVLAQARRERQGLPAQGGHGHRPGQGRHADLGGRPAAHADADAGRGGLGGTRPGVRLVALQPGRPDAVERYPQVRRTEAARPDDRRLEDADEQDKPVGVADPTVADAELADADFARLASDLGAQPEVATPSNTPPPAAARAAGILQPRARRRPSARVAGTPRFGEMTDARSPMSPADLEKSRQRSRAQPDIVVAF